MKLTPKQEQMVLDAIGDGTNWPKFTTDPYVNHAIDMLILDEPEWEDLTKEEQNTYFEEME